MVVALGNRKMVVMRNEGDARYPALEVISDREPDQPDQLHSSSDLCSNSPEDIALSVASEKSFVAEAVRNLEQIQSKADAKFILLAHPEAIGEFRRHCDPGLADRIVAEIPRSVPYQSTDHIAQSVQAFEPE